MPALTGSSSTSHEGLFGIANTLQLFRQNLVYAPVGDYTSTPTLKLIDQSIATSLGNTAPPLVGALTTNSLGFLDGYLGKLLLGVPVTSATGTLGLTKSSNTPLTGVEVTIGQTSLVLPVPAVPSGNTIDNNILIAYMDYTLLPEAVVTSVDTWVSTLPLSNMVNTDLGKSARTLNTSASFAIDISESNSGNVFAIPKHNLTDAATWRVRASNNILLLTDPDAVPYSQLEVDTAVLTSSPSGTFIDVQNPPATMTLEVDLGLSISDSVKIYNGSGNYLIANVDAYNSGTKLLTFTKTSGSAAIYSSSTWNVANVNNILKKVWHVNTSFSPSDNVVPPALFVTAETITARYYYIEIEDSSNPLGYLDIYKAVVSPAWQPTINLSHKWRISYVDKSKLTRSRGGQAYLDLVPQYRKLKIALQGFSKTEMMANKLEMDRLVGTYTPVLISLAPLDTESLADKSIYGTQSKLTKIQEYGNNITKTSIEIEEWV